MPRGDGGRFLDELRRRTTDPSRAVGLSVVWVAGGVVEGQAVVLFRQRADGPLVGRRYDLDRYAALFDSTDEVDLAGTVFVSEVSEPSRGARLLDVPWADGLKHGEEPVHWLGVA